MRVIVSTGKLQEMDVGVTDVFETELYERYAAHPLGNPSDSMSLAHFGVWYQWSRFSVGACYWDYTICYLQLSLETNYSGCIKNVYSH